MLKKLSANFYKYLLNFAELQLVITLMSLPILICWGIPISTMFLISNLIFTPLLILFLWISALFALCSLTNIPCQLFVYALSLITKTWLWLLSFSKPSWLLGFCSQTLFFGVIIVIAIIVWYSTHKPKISHSIIFLTCCLSIILSVRSYYQKSFISQVGNLNMIALRMAGKNYVFDYGTLCNKQNFYSHIDYTIIPELIKHTGMTTIDTLMLCKPSKRLAQVAWQFGQQTNTATILAPKKLSCYKTLQMINQQEHQNKKIIPYCSSSPKFAGNSSSI